MAYADRVRRFLYYNDDVLERRDGYDDTVDIGDAWRCYRRLDSGLRKSIKLGIHVSWSMAFRNTMGKMVTYVAFVMMVALIDAACGHQFKIAMWSCLFVCLLEGGSIISNLMKPYGVDITPKSIFAFAVKVFSAKVIRIDGGEGSFSIDDDKMDTIKEREKGRWERRTRSAKD